MSLLPFSQACENNKAPILAVLKPLLHSHHQVLEIGSGTAQHAVYFSAAMPHLRWQTSDLPAYHAGIRARLAAEGSDNALPPLALDVRDFDWSSLDVDAVFTANTLHIMSWDSAKQAIAGIGGCLPTGGLLVVYGPFNYQGHYTSDSNASFDDWLKQQHPDSAIRDFEAVTLAAKEAQLNLIADHDMPANNRILVWEKQT